MKTQRRAFIGRTGVQHESFGSGSSVCSNSSDSSFLIDPGSSREV